MDQLDASALQYLFNSGIILAKRDRILTPLNEETAAVKPLIKTVENITNSASKPIPADSIISKFPSPEPLAKPILTEGSESQAKKSLTPGSTPSISGLTKPLKPASSKLEKEVPKIHDNIVNDSAEIVYEGSFESRILIISNRHLLYADYLFLFKVLDAIGLSIKDIALLNKERNNHTLEAIFAKFVPVKLISFGLDPSVFAEDGTQYNAITFKNCMVIAANSIAEISENQDKRRLLWNSLKKNFV